MTIVKPSAATPWQTTGDAMVDALNNQENGAGWHLTSTVSIPNAALTAVSGWTADWSTGVTISSGNVAFTTTGMYLVMCQAYFASNANGRRQLIFGSVGDAFTTRHITIQSPCSASSAEALMTASTILRITATGPSGLGMGVYQDSGGALSLNGPDLTWMRIGRLGPTF
jgi:hypothetical protein